MVTPDNPMMCHPCLPESSRNTHREPVENPEEPIGILRNAPGRIHLGELEPGTLACEGTPRGPRTLKGDNLSGLPAGPERSET